LTVLSLNPEIEITQLKGDVALVRQEIQQANKSLEEVKATLKELLNQLPSIRNDVNRANENLLNLKLDFKRYTEDSGNKISDLEDTFVTLKVTVERHDYIIKWVVGFVTGLTSYVAIQLINIFISSVK